MCKLLSSKKLLYCKKKKALFCMLWDDDVLLFCVWQWDGDQAPPRWLAMMMVVRLVVMCGCFGSRQRWGAKQWWGGDKLGGMRR